MNPISKDSIRYKDAERRVKYFKIFYVFAFVYFAVNIFIMFINYKELKPGETIWHLKYFSLPIFWGIGLIGYAINVFVPGVILGSNWEEKKIKKLMEKEKESQNKD